MAIILAYIALIAIWATTPLAIKWSTADISFVGGIFWRILLSAILALCILKIRRQALFPTKAAARIYAVSALSIAPNFLLVYWAANWIPSGLISVIFSTVPLLIAIMSLVFLKQNIFTRNRVIALALAMIGMLTIFFDQLSIGKEGALGVVAMVLSVLIFAGSNLWFQQLHNPLTTLQTTTGGLCFSVPPLAICWWFMDGIIPINASNQALLSIMYLGIVGSLIGFFLYYFLLHRLAAHIVTTVGMISPVFALFLGNQLANEAIGSRLIIGAIFVLVGLALYHSGSFAKLKSQST